MYYLIDRLVARLRGDATLTALANISLEQQPDSPKQLSKLAVVLKLDGGEDEQGLHGGASNPMIEVHIWGYYGRNTTEVEASYRAMDRMDALILRKMETTDGGKTLRWRSFTGWQSIDEATDPRIIHYRNVYMTRYWSMNRVDALQE